MWEMKRNVTYFFFSQIDAEAEYLTTRKQNYMVKMSKEILPSEG